MSEVRDLPEWRPFPNRAVLSDLIIADDANPERQTYYATVFQSRWFSGTPTYSAVVHHFVRSQSGNFDIGLGSPEPFATLEEAKTFAEEWIRRKPEIIWREPE